MYEILENFSREVLRHQPADVIAFASAYFEAELRKRKIYGGYYTIESKLGWLKFGHFGKVKLPGWIHFPFWVHGKEEILHVLQMENGSTKEGLLFQNFPILSHPKF